MTVSDEITSVSRWVTQRNGWICKGVKQLRTLSHLHFIKVEVLTAESERQIPGSPGTISKGSQLWIGEG